MADWEELEGQRPLFTEEDVETRWRDLAGELFRTLDYSTTGHIPLDALLFGLTVMGCTDSKRIGALERALTLDTKKSSFDRSEFVEIVLSELSCRTEQELEAMLQLFKSGNNNNSQVSTQRNVTASDLGRVAQELGIRIGQEELKQMIQEFDPTGQGNVSFEDLKDIYYGGNVLVNTTTIINDEDYTSFEEEA